MQLAFEKKKQHVLGHYRKQNKQGEAEDMEFPGVLKKEHMWKFQGLIKKELEFPGLLM